MFKPFGVPFKIPHKVTKEKAFKMGYDCGKNGPNTTKCHFSVFGSIELRKEWEKGNKKARKERS